MATALVCRRCLRNISTVRASSYQAIQTISAVTTPRRNSPQSVQLRHATTLERAAPRGAIDHRLDQASAAAGRRMKQEKPDATDSVPAQAATEIIFRECAAQADYYVPQIFQGKEVPKTENGEEIGQGSGWWYENLDLLPTFKNWSSVTFIHVYLIIVRFRYFPAEYAKLWIQSLTDHMFYEFEHRMTIFHNVTSKTVRNKYLKDLHDQWRGVQGAYDEGLMRGDAVLAAAVWRNLFRADENVDWKKVALVVGFMRRGLRALDRAQDKTLVGGMVRFGSPMSEKAVVEMESEMMKQPFTKADDHVPEEEEKK